MNYTVYNYIILSLYNYRSNKRIEVKNKIINSKDNTFKSKKEISDKFNEIIDFNDYNRVFSCGSGITACVLGLAYSLVNNTYSPTVYDGSWAEYGRI